ncbi:hypothetical protein A0J61_05468 [Choanephora cucurbitarum]|uniref:Uncharacterized protein n=1 Tax=Choanephora cucurbitarum TaxID=101091 RepID=A0A1C7NBH5_9FUNG|nr:hypothetical protein A0J61_05468 [Choanephora cucurbitarum]
MKKTETIDEFIQKFRYLSHVTEITNEAVLCELFVKALFNKLQQCFKVYLTLISETKGPDLSKAGVSIDFLMDLVRKAYYVFFTDEPIKHAGFKRPRPDHEECIFHPSTRMIHSTIDCRSLKKFKKA